MSGGIRLPVKHQAALAKVGRLALETGDLGALLHRSASLVAETLAVEFCNILELLPDRQSLVLRAGVGWKKGLIGEAVAPATSETDAGQALVSRTPVIVEDFRAETGFQPTLLHDHDVTSGVSVAIPGGDSFGVLGIHTRRRRSFALHEVEFLESVAQALSRAIDQCRANKFVLDDTETPQAQRQRERDLRLARFTLDRAQEAIFWVRPDGRFTGANYGAAQMVGHTPDELLRMRVWDVDRSVSGEDWPEIWEDLRKRGFLTLESSFRGPDGRIIPVELTVSYLEFHGEQSACAIGRDVSEQRQAREALRKSEEHFRALIENTLDLITIIDTSGTVRYVSPSIERVLGYRPEERLGKNTFELIHPDDLAGLQEALAAGARTPNATAGLVFRARHKDGSWRHLESIARNLLDNPDVAGVVVNSRDITTRKLAEEKIRASEEWFRSSFEYAGVPTTIMSVEGRFLRVNPAMCRFLGRSEQELLQLSWREITHPDDVKVSRDMRRKLLAGDAPTVEAEKRYIHRDGSVLRGYLTLSLIRDAKGRPARVAAQVVDVTERREAEEALRQSEQRFRLGAESASDFIYEWDVASGQLEWHGDVDTCLGYNHGRFPRTIEAWKASLHPEDRDRVLQATERVLAGAIEPPDVEYRMKTRKRGYRYWSSRGRCLRDETGRVYKWIGACSDITQRQRTEQSLRESEAELRSSQKELRALAGRLIGNEEEEHHRLAGELHDDFSQRLTAVIFELAGLEEVCSESGPSPLKERLHTARERVASLSDDMRRLAHQLHPAAIELFGLPAALRQLCEEASHAGPNRVRFTGRTLPESFSRDVSLCLYRVTQESLRNAAKHSGAAQVSVTLSGVTQGLRLSVKDNGCGFDPASAEKKGGLGLISMRERVRLVDGSLAVNSRLGRGTLVVVEIPSEASG